MFVVVEDVSAILVLPNMLMKLQTAILLNYLTAKCSSKNI